MPAHIPATLLTLAPCIRPHPITDSLQGRRRTQGGARAGHRGAAAVSGVGGGAGQRALRAHQPGRPVRGWGGGGGEVDGSAAIRLPAGLCAAAIRPACQLTCSTTPCLLPWHRCLHVFMSTPTPPHPTPRDLLCAGTPSRRAACTAPARWCRRRLWRGTTAWQWWSRWAGGGPWGCGAGRHSDSLPLQLKFSQSIAPVRVRLVCTAANSRTPFLPNAAAHLQVGPGVKGLAENDWVVPLKPNLGTWRSLAGAAGSGMAAAGCRQEQRPWEG